MTLDIYYNMIQHASEHITEKDKVKIILMLDVCEGRAWIKSGYLTRCSTICIQSFVYIRVNKDIPILKSLEFCIELGNPILPKHDPTHSLGQVDFVSDLG